MICNLGGGWGPLGTKIVGCTTGYSGQLEQLREEIPAHTKAFFAAHKSQKNLDDVLLIETENCDSCSRLSSTAMAIL